MPRANRIPGFIARNLTCRTANAFLSLSSLSVTSRPSLATSFCSDDRLPSIRRAPPRASEASTTASLRRDSTAPTPRATSLARPASARALSRSFSLARRRASEALRSAARDDALLLAAASWAVSAATSSENLAGLGARSTFWCSWSSWVSRVLARAVARRWSRDRDSRSLALVLSSCSA